MNKMRRGSKAAVMGALGSLLVSCSPSAPREQPATPQATSKPSAPTPPTPSSSGHADVNGIKLYHEVYGQGPPLVLLPGGLMTIGEMSTLLEPFAKTHKVIAVELQGHGRTADTDRPLRLETMGDDIAA